MADLFNGPGMLPMPQNADPASRAGMLDPRDPKVRAAIQLLISQGITRPSAVQIAETLATMTGGAPAAAPQMGQRVAPAGSIEAGITGAQDADLEARRAAEAAAMKARQQEFLRARSAKIVR